MKPVVSCNYSACFFILLFVLQLFSLFHIYLQDEVQKAVSILVKCVHHKFASAKKSPKGEVVSLATVSSEQAGIDPVALYRKLLLQRLPYDHKCPPLMPGVTLHNLGREKLFLWLSYWYVTIIVFIQFTYT